MSRVGKTMYDDEIYETMNPILVIHELDDGDFIMRDFYSIDKVADYVGAKSYKIEQVLKGKTIKGSTWKPGIYYQNLDNGKQYRYLIVLTEEWKNYSQTKKLNRFKKLVE